MTKYEFNRIVGLNDLINDLGAQGIEVTDHDLDVAAEIFSMYDDTVIRKQDYRDGFTSEETAGYVFDSTINSLLKLHPNTAKLLTSLTREKNYGFVVEDGSVKRTGLMGAIDPITEVRNLAEAYTNNGNVAFNYGGGDIRNKKMLYASKEEYEAASRGHNQELSDMFDEEMPEYEFVTNDNYTR